MFITVDGLSCAARNTAKGEGLSRSMTTTTGHITLTDPRGA